MDRKSVDGMKKDGVEEFMREVLNLVEDMVGDGVRDGVEKGPGDCAKENEDSLKQNQLNSYETTQKGTKTKQTNTKQEQNCSKTRKIKQQKSEKNNREDTPKKQKMRCCDDVIKRIIWDEKLDGRDFVVGYEDRFLGELEADFNDFCWQDLSTLGPDVFAIPKHRIRCRGGEEEGGKKEEGEEKNEVEKEEKN